MAAASCVGLQPIAFSTVRTDLLTVYRDIFRALRSRDHFERVSGILAVRGGKTAVSCVLTCFFGIDEKYGVCGMIWI